MLADELHKSASPQIFFFYTGISLCQLHKFLGKMPPYRHDQAAARSQLLHQGLRDLVAAGSYNDGIKRAFFFPALGTVGIPGHDVVEPQPVKSVRVCKKSGWLRSMVYTL